MKNQDHGWLVFDKDDFPDFNNLINQIMTNKSYKNYHCAYSNPCFELWYLLHYCFIEQSLDTKDLISQLENSIGKTYEKNDKEMYTLLRDNQNTAIDNADKLIKKNKTNNPSTAVGILVNQLNKHLRK